MTRSTLATTDPSLRRGEGLRPRLWRALGGALFGLGLLGLAVPLLPTTIFWILAALCLGRADPALAARIRAWPGVGATVSDFLDHGVIGRGAKGAALAGMGVSAALLTMAAPPAWALTLGLGALAGAAVWVASRRECAPEA